MESEARFTDPRPDCPEPGRWHSPDSDSTEIEVSQLVGAFVAALRPDLVIETGTAFGQTAWEIGMSLIKPDEKPFQVLREPYGKLITFEVDPERAEASRDRVRSLPVEVHQEDSLKGLGELSALVKTGQRPKIGFAWLDSLFELRVRELRLVAPHMTPGGIIGVHDCGEPGNTKYPQFSTTIAREASNLGLSRLSLPTPRGVTFLQKGFK